MKQAEAIEVLELTEYEPKNFDRNLISNSTGEALWRVYGKKVSVNFPSPVTGWQWQLSSLGWVGYIRFSESLRIKINPKVELSSLFGMLEYAYRLESFRFYEGLVDCESLDELYQRLARVLALKVLDRARRGFYREYKFEKAQLPFVRGRINLGKAIRSPWDTNLECHYEENAADIEDNQILSWTLSRIAQSGICAAHVLTTVRSAFRSLRGISFQKSFSQKDCVDRLYNRLNNDYQSLHALCRFFLEHTGPSHEYGDRKVIPFLVNMARLYELFVAEWLKKHLPSGLSLKAQEKVDVGEGDTLSFKIDLVLYDNATGKARCVLDTKYKALETPSTDDVAKVVAYAEMKDCNEAMLVYPVALSIPIDSMVGKIRVRSVTFALEGDLEEQGVRFMQKILDSLS